MVYVKLAVETDVLGPNLTSKNSVGDQIPNMKDTDWQRLRTM